MKHCLTAESAFSRAVYKLIRPRIPKAQWPADCFHASFSPAEDGLVLEARFSGLPSAYAALASQLVREARVDLVLASPAAGEAASTFRVRRWRDVFLYAFLPLLFAIPITAEIGEAAKTLFIMLFLAGAAALVITHLALIARRAALANAAFAAEIPVPGQRLRISIGERPPA